MGDITFDLFVEIVGGGGIGWRGDRMGSKREGVTPIN